MTLTGAGVISNGGCSQATTFLARTSGLDSTHQGYYTTLICGLVTDGIWNKLDVLYVFATSSSSNALLNLISTSYTATANGSPTFTAYAGFTGSNGSTTVNLDTGFTPSTAGGNYTQNSASYSVWSAANTSSALSPMGVQSGSTSDLFPRYSSDGNTYMRINDSGASGGVATATANGQYIAVRSGASTQAGYKNGSSVGITSVASAALASTSFPILGEKISGVVSGAAYQIAMASIGGAFTSTDATNFYNLERAYLTSVGCTC